MTQRTHDEEIHEAVRERYAKAAKEAEAMCCSPTGAAVDLIGRSLYGDDEVDALPEGALAASLGCGNPTMLADLRAGDVVLDLGSGGGIDVLLSARRVAPGGKAYGLDGSADMIALARDNATQAGVTNAEFLHGHIEDIPLPDATVDVVISNCVINLSADKARTLAEAFRVLRPGGRLGISDVIADEGLDPVQRAQAEQRVGCCNGALTQSQYAEILQAAGFAAIGVTPTHQAEPGLHSAIIQAAKPAAT